MGRPVQSLLKVALNLSASKVVSFVMYLIVLTYLSERKDCLVVGMNSRINYLNISNSINHFSFNQNLKLT